MKPLKIAIADTRDKRGKKNTYSLRKAKSMREGTKYLETKEK